MKLLILALTLCFSSTSMALEGVFGILKYDSHKWMEQAPMPQWQGYADRVVGIARDYGFTGLVIPPTAPINNWKDPGQMQRLLWMRDKQLYLLDQLHAAGMSAIIMTGNPTSDSWARAGKGYPFHGVYTHPAVIAFKSGDETNDREWPKLVSRYQALREAYPDKDIITIFIGEAIGGTTGTGEILPDRLPQYVDWWKKLGTQICTVRNYWLRSRQRPDRGQVGDYDLHHPYVPGKLAVHPDKMAQLVRDNCPGTDWAFVGQGFGKCAELGRECYWRFPTEREMLEQIDFAHRHGAKWFLVFSLTPSKEGHLALLDDDLNPMQAHDGSYPVDAFRKIAKYLRKPLAAPSPPASVE